MTTCTATCVPDAFGCLPPEIAPGSECRDDIYFLPSLLTSAECAEVEEALALTDLDVTCFNCCFGASFERSGQFWCSVNCWVDVMNGGRDY